MKMPKQYVVTYHYYLKTNGEWEDREMTRTVTATTKKEARQIFDAWHEQNGWILKYLHGQPVRRHPFRVEIA